MNLTNNPRYEVPGADVMKRFGKGIHKYVGLDEVRM